MQLVTYEIDITIEQPSFGQKFDQCSSGEMWHHNGLSAPKWRNEFVVKRQSPIVFVVRAMFIIFKFNVASAIFALLFPP